MGAVGHRGMGVVGHRGMGAVGHWVTSYVLRHHIVMSRM